MKALSGTRTPSRVDSDSHVEMPQRSAEDHFSITPVGVATGALRRLPVSEDPLGGSPVPAHTLDILRRRHGGGRQLPERIAVPMSEQLGVDLSAVRVHTDTESQAVSRSLQARAFTHGSDIYFDRGAYDPGSTAGRQVLAHELAHVVQQSSESISDSTPIVGRMNDPAEAAADAVAHSVLQGLRNTAASVGPVSVRRWPMGHDRLDSLRRQAHRVILRDADTVLLRAVSPGTVTGRR